MMINSTGKHNWRTVSARVCTQIVRVKARRKLASIVLLLLRLLQVNFEFANYSISVQKYGYAVVREFKVHRCAVLTADRAAQCSRGSAKFPLVSSHRSARRSIDTAVEESGSDGLLVRRNQSTSVTQRRHALLCFALPDTRVHRFSGGAGTHPVVRSLPARRTRRLTTSAANLSAFVRRRTSRTSSVAAAALVLTERAQLGLE